MTDMLAIVRDEREIAAQLNNYCRAMDLCDKALARAVFHPDGEADYGAIFKGGAYDLVEFTIGSHHTLETHLHRISNISIALDGDRAGSETYVDAVLVGKSAAGLFEIRTCGRYIDQWERREGRWAISRRTYVHASDSRRAVEGQRYANAGVRDASDPSYAALTPKR